MKLYGLMDQVEIQEIDFLGNMIISIGTQKRVDIFLILMMLQNKEEQKRNNMKKNTDKNGKVFFSIKSNGKIYKYYEDEKLCPPDVFTNISHLQQKDPERIGYRTQKPEKLLERIIKCASNEGNVILDFFGGGGTTAKVCSDLKRKFIIGDISPIAVRVTADRLSSHVYRNYEIKGLPSTKQDYLNMNAHEFADMICELMGWTPNLKKSGDRGIDGFANGGDIPIQIKNQRKKTGRPDVQKFLGALNKHKKGFFVSWDFSPEAWEFRASIEGKEIEFFKIGELLNGLLISDNTSKEHKKLYTERIKKTLNSEARIEQDDEVSDEDKRIRKKRIQKVRKIKPKGKKHRVLKISK